MLFIYSNMDEGYRQTTVAELQKSKVVDAMLSASTKTFEITEKMEEVLAGLNDECADPQKQALAREMQSEMAIFEGLMFESFIDATATKLAFCAGLRKRHRVSQTDEKTQ